MKYYFWILGCAMNYSDAERMSTILESIGYTRTMTEKEAELFIVISCSVRQSAVLKIYGKVKELNEYRLQNTKFKTILTGCVIDKDKKKLGKVFDVMLEMKDLDKLPELLSSEGDPRFRKDDSVAGDYLSVIPKYQSNFRAYVPISTGCDNFCSYCAVPYTKGREKSRPMDEIITEVKNLIEKGFKEITLLGQNVNSFGKDLSSSVTPAKAGVQKKATEKLDSSLRWNDESLFAQLLTKLDAIPGDYRIYFYSNHPKDMTDNLISILATLKHFPHYIHLPLQSGNDEILRKMNRHNTKEQYLELVAKIRKTMPDINLTTDIIVGFPGETDEQFQDTVEVMEKAEYDMAFIAQYSPRPGTVSAKMEDDISDEVKKERELVLQKIVTKTVLRHNEKLIGTTQRVLIDGEKNGKYYGRSKGYKVVEIKTDQDLQIGQFVNVKIDKVSSWKLVGTLLSTSS